MAEDLDIDGLSAEQVLLRDNIRRYLKDKVSPLIAKAEADKQFPYEVLTGLRDFGYLGGITAECVRTGKTLKYIFLRIPAPVTHFGYQVNHAQEFIDIVSYLTYRLCLYFCEQFPAHRNRVFFQGMCQFVHKAFIGKYHRVACRCTPCTCLDISFQVMTITAEIRNGCGREIIG